MTVNTGFTVLLLLVLLLLQIPLRYHDTSRLGYDNTTFPRSQKGVHGGGHGGHGGHAGHAGHHAAYASHNAYAKNSDSNSTLGVFGIYLKIYCWIMVSL